MNGTLTFKVFVFCKPDWIEIQSVFASKKSAVETARKYFRSYVLCVESGLICHTVGRSPLQATPA